MGKRNDCVKCREFDNVTRDKMRELFGREEILVTASSLVAFLMSQIGVEKQLKRADLRRFQVRKDIDMVGRTMGKFMVALEPKDREMFLFNIKQSTGVVIDVNDESCPHGNESTDALTAPIPGNN